jgi:alpha-galactosidase
MRDALRKVDRDIVYSLCQYGMGSVWEWGVWARPLSDGTIAAGLFNRGLQSARMTIKWSELGLGGPQQVRNLWLQRDLGPFNGESTTDVPAHGAVLLKTERPKR